MSGFDVTMRSQQQVNQSQQFYDSQRYQMMGQMGQTIGQAPAMLQEIAVRQQDADMRLALQQQEFQSNAMKLQAMTAIDQADLMREQVRGAKLQNDAMEFDMRQRQEQMGMQKEQMHSVRVERMVQALGGGRGMLAAGVKFDPQTQSFGVMTDEEKKAAAKDVGATEFNSRRNYLLQLYKMALDQGNDEEAARVYEEYRALGGVQPAAPRQPKATPAQQQQIAAQQAQVADIVDVLGPLSRPQSTMVSPGGNPVGRPAGGFLERGRVESIVSFVVANQDELHRQAMQTARAGRKNMKVGETPAETAKLYLLELLNSGSQWQKLMIDDLLRNGVISPEEAQTILSR